MTRMERAFAIFLMALVTLFAIEHVWLEVQAEYHSPKVVGP